MSSPRHGMRPDYRLPSPRALDRMTPIHGPVTRAECRTRRVSCRHVHQLWLPLPSGVSAVAWIATDSDKRTTGATLRVAVKTGQDRARCSYERSSSKTARSLPGPLKSFVMATLPMV